MPATLAELVASSVVDKYANTSTILLENILISLQTYVAGDRKSQPFARFCCPPEWAIDKTPGADLSYFEKNWGTPPRRVGRDNRYRPMHEYQPAPADEKPAASATPVPIPARGRRQP